MQRTIPTHLASTYKLLQCTFPQGISDEFYLPLLSILYEEMSDRNLAEVISEFTRRDYHTVLNDVYRVAAIPISSPELVEFVRQKLTNCNYEKWLVED
jgi:hypothetical protein